MGQDAGMDRKKIHTGKVSLKQIITRHVGKGIMEEIHKALLMYVYEKNMYKIFDIHIQINQT